MSLAALHAFEVALVTPTLKMTERGLRVDETVRTQMLADLDAALDPLHTLLQAKAAPLLERTTSALFRNQWVCTGCRNGSKKRLTCATCGGEGKRIWNAWNPESEKQNKILLYELLKLPKRTRDGKIVSDEEALKALLAHDRSGVVEALLTFAKHATMRSTLERMEPSADGRLRTWYNIAGTETGRFSSAETFLETSCLTGDAEVLTRFGWFRFDALPGNDVEVMQWNPTTNKLSWCLAPITRAKFEGDLVEAGSWFHQHAYTPNHRVPTFSYRGLFKEHRANELLDLSLLKLPVAGHKIGGTNEITPEIARLLAAFQADGSFFGINTDVRWAFKKERKIRRIRQLMKAAGWRWTRNKATGHIKARFRIAKKYTEPLVKWLGLKKRFGAWLLDMPYESLKALVEETKYWDGHIRKDSWWYLTISKENAHWIATAAHLVGYSASIRVCANRGKGSYGEFTAQPLYTVAIKPRDFTVLEKKSVRRVPFIGTVYCVTTNTSYFLTRRNGRIIVTGNTNLQNLAAKQAARSSLYDVRRCVVPDASEVFLYADLSQAEARVVAALSNDRELLERWEDPCFDIHRWTAAHIFAKDLSDVTKDERILGKTARHALNYALGWAAFLRKVNGDADITGVAIDAATAKRIVAGYHRLHPHLELWWRRVGSLLDAQGWLSTVFGRRRTFFGRREIERWLDATHREAIAFEPQATVADLLNRGLLRYWQQHDLDGCRGDLPDEWTGPLGGGRLLAQVHDAVLVSCPAALAEHEAAALVACLEEEIEVAGIRLTIPVDVKMSSANWSETTMRKVPKRLEAVVA